MIEIKRKAGLMPARPEPFTVQPLRETSAVDRPPAPAEELPFYERHLSSNASNARLPGILGDGEWTVKWSAGLPAEALSVIRAGDSILCQWPGMWRLLDAAGKPVHQDYSGRSPIVIDARAKNFQLITASLSWEVRNLSSGELLFRNALPYNENFTWPVLYRSGNRMLALADVQPAFRHGGQSDGSSLLQLIELQTPVQTDASKLVQNLARFESLEITAEPIFAAAHNDTIAVAAEGVLALFASTLTVTAAVSMDFAPLFISMDEAGWIYLSGRAHQDRVLWVLNPQGARTAAWTIPNQVADPIQPPILGYDRRVYLLSGSQLVALGNRAEPLWIKPVPGGADGAGVTVDGRVLVCAGNALLAFDAAGEHRELHRFEERITTPPVYTSQHEIVVGAGHNVHCLAKRR